MKIGLFKKRTDYKTKPKVFYFRVNGRALSRGYDQTIHVWHNRRSTGFPVKLGIVEIQHGNHPGTHATAGLLVSELFGYKHDGCDIIRKDVKIYEVF